MTPLPAHLPPLPYPPVGHHWVYRGQGWKSKDKTFYAVCDEPRLGSRWDVSYPHKLVSGGIPQLYYAELVSDLPAVPPDKGGDVTTPQHVPAQPLKQPSGNVFPASHPTTDPFEAEGHV